MFGVWRHVEPGGGVWYPAPALLAISIKCLTIVSKSDRFKYRDSNPGPQTLSASPSMEQKKEKEQKEQPLLRLPRWSPTLVLTELDELNFADRPGCGVLIMI